MFRKQHQPWSTQVELTEGCSRLCAFCGLNGLRNGPGNFRYMTKETATRVAGELARFCPGVRVEFAMHGEPTMNPNHLWIIEHFRAQLPKTQIQITTNGVRFMNGKMQRHLELLFAAGVNFVVLDTYYPERNELREQAAKLNGVKVVDLYDEEFHICHNHGTTITRTLTLFDDLLSGRNKRPVFNHTGSNPMKGFSVQEPLRKTCTIPFREVSVCYDGVVAVCCMDWTRRYVCGDLKTQSLETIWHGEEFKAARAMLASKNRNFGACRYCDASSGSRVGFLPNDTGAVTEEVIGTVTRVTNEGIARNYGQVSKGLVK